MELKKKAGAKAVIITALALITTACGGANTMYNWGGYSNSLLGYYKNQDDAQLEKFSNTLLEGIQKAEIDDTVPPGMYAEYGYTRLELNDANTASVYFEKEWEKWPESRFLMEKVMERLTTTTTEPAVPGDV
ncbi:MAG: DUF4810 domain-containing protein [Kordiimonadaceae bacterium]|nr:DUF4810 domain-containing protein [Kordiimonadaceae bacterium]